MSGTHVRVGIGAEEYALPVEDVLEVAELGDLTRVPGAPSGVLGVRNLRGQVLPVVDLAALLGSGDGEPAERMVVAERCGARTGLAVDRVVGVEELPPPTEPADAEHLKGAAIVDGTLIGFLDVDSLLAAIATGGRT